MSDIINSLKTFVENKFPSEPKTSAQQQTADNIDYYRMESEQSIKQRIADLNDEWDVERNAALNGSVGVIAGLLLGATVSKKWLTLPAAIGGFFAWHAVTGRPLPEQLTRGLRTRKQITQEQCGLQQILKDGVNKHDY